MKKSELKTIIRECLNEKSNIKWSKEDGARKSRQMVGKIKDVRDYSPGKVETTITRPGTLTRVGNLSLLGGSKDTIYRRNGEAIPRNVLHRKMELGQHSRPARRSR